MKNLIDVSSVVNVDTFLRESNEKLQEAVKVLQEDLSSQVREGTDESR